MELAQKCPHPAVIRTGGIDRRHQVPVAIAEIVHVHFRHEIGGAIDVVAAGCAEQAAFAAQALVKPGAGQGVEHSDHRGGDAAVLNELDLAAENRKRIRVEADDESALHLEAGALESFDVRQQIPAAVLPLVALRESRLVRSLDADEHGIESRRHDVAGQRLVIGEVDGRLGIEPERVMPRLLPTDQRRQQVLAQPALVADEIVIDKKNRTAPTGCDQGVKFGDYLRSGLCAAAAAELGGDVAELAVEGTTARILHAHRAVVTHVRKFPQRHRRCLQVGETQRTVDALGTARFEIAQEIRQGHLRLVQHKMIDLFVIRVRAGEQGSTGHHRPAGGLAACDQPPRGLALGNHSTDENQIRPIQVRIPEFGNVQVDEAFVPLLRQHCGHRQQAERRQGRPFVHELQRVLEAPERVRKFRVKQQDVFHRTICTGLARCNT